MFLYRDRMIMPLSRDRSLLQPHLQIHPCPIFHSTSFDRPSKARQSTHRGPNLLILSHGPQPYPLWYVCILQMHKKWSLHKRRDPPSLVLSRRVLLRFLRKLSKSSVNLVCNSILCISRWYQYIRSYIGYSYLDKACIFHWLHLQFT